jgi:hypothetical protein
MIEFFTAGECDLKIDGMKIVNRTATPSARRLNGLGIDGTVNPPVDQKF